LFLVIDMHDFLLVGTSSYKQWLIRSS